MDPKLERALESSQYRETLNNQMQALKSQVEVKLMYSINGGTFSVSPELITFVELLISKGQTESVLLDINRTPILITDLKDFQTNILSRYYEVTNDYLTQYEKIRKARSVNKIVGK
jgi:hypothetical protein